MMNCRNVRKLIDEADNVDILPFNATAHTDSCPDCRRLADQRRELSALLSSTERVSAPANFDTVLRMKLDERLAKRWFPFT
ncbi:MAG: anti-sigma factor family protein, partial [Blastocatellia bacterium]